MASSSVDGGSSVSISASSASASSRSSGSNAAYSTASGSSESCESMFISAGNISIAAEKPATQGSVDSSGSVSSSSSNTQGSNHCRPEIAVISSR